MSAKVISFMNRKGGVGKSTMVTLTATSLHHRTGLKIAVIDADAQQSVAKQRQEELEMFPEENFYEIIPFSWQEEHKGDIPVIRFRDMIEEIEDRFDIILIDSPGKQEGQEIPIIVTISDYIVVPLIASSYDLQSTLDFLGLIPPISEKRKKQGYDLKVFGLINKKDRTIEQRYLTELDGHNGMKMFTSEISNKVRYRRDKSTVTDLISPQVDDEFNQYFLEFVDKCEL
jgi:chromosome partitioning protein